MSYILCPILSGLSYPSFGSDKHAGTLHVMLGIFIAYMTCHLFLCTHVLIFGAQKQAIIYLSVHLTNLLCIHLSLLTLTCFIIDYRVIKHIRCILWHCQFPSEIKLPFANDIFNNHSIPNDMLTSKLF